VRRCLVRATYLSSASVVAVSTCGAISSARPYLTLGVAVAVGALHKLLVRSHYIPACSLVSVVIVVFLTERLHRSLVWIQADVFVLKATTYGTSKEVKPHVSNIRGSPDVRSGSAYRPISNFSTQPKFPERLVDCSETYLRL